MPTELFLLERADEDNPEAVNDLSEDMRKELDNIYQAIAAITGIARQDFTAPRVQDARGERNKCCQRCRNRCCRSCNTGKICWLPPPT